MPDNVSPLEGVCHIMLRATVTQLKAPETANIDAAAPIERLAHDGFALLVPHIIQKACAIMFEKKAVRSRSRFISGLSIVR